MEYLKFTLFIFVIRNIFLAYYNILYYIAYSYSICAIYLSLSIMYCSF